jgi:enamine deaminase RidA (YjgF/YER057c/UK114 family)
VSRRLISSGSTFEAEIGYSRAVVDGEWVFVSGTTGFDYRSMTIAEGLAEQTEQCLRNIQAALAEAGGSLADVVRVVYVLPKADEFPACWPIPAAVFRRGTARRHDDLGRAIGPADADRNRSHGTAGICRGAAV